MPPDTLPAPTIEGPTSRPWSRGPAISVAIHDVEPRTYHRVREIRHWLEQRGCDRVTLAVVPAADLHPLGTRSPALISWLRARVARGDAIAQHGLRHRADGREFTHLGLEESLSRVRAGLSLLREVELDPAGFIAPAYAYTPALRDVLVARFQWFAERAAVHGPESSLRAPALALGAGQLTRWISPAWIRLRAGQDRALMRLDVHPGDLDSSRHVAALAAVLEHAADRQVVTYDDVFCSHR